MQQTDLGRDKAETINLYGPSLSEKAVRRAVAFESDQQTDLDRD